MELLELVEKVHQLVTTYKQDLLHHQRQVQAHQIHHQGGQLHQEQLLQERVSGIQMELDQQEVLHGHGLLQYSI